MKEKVEKIKVWVYGGGSAFRFSFILRYHPVYDIQEDIDTMIREGRKEAKRILNESHKVFREKYGGYLDKNITWLEFENGLYVEAM